MRHVLFSHCTSALNPHPNRIGRYNSELHLTAEEVGPQRGYVTCLWSHSWKVAEPGFEPEQPGSGVAALSSTLIG